MLWEIDMESRHWRFLACALSMGALVALAAAGPALACKGNETLLRDDFTEQDPAWNVGSLDVKIGGGALMEKAVGGRVAILSYAGMDFPGADVCVDIVTPSAAAENSRAGIGFWNGKAWDFVYIAPDGSAGVDRLMNNNWYAPVPNRKFDGVKAGGGATNRLRVTWKAPPADNAKAAPDPTVMIFINDKPFIKYKVPPNIDRTIATYVDGGQAGAAFEFKNLVVTSY
jgi:hypothetical protein